MKKKLFLIAIMLSSANLLMASDFIGLVKNSERCVHDLTSTYDLAQCDNFIRIYKSPIHWKKDAESAIVLRELSFTQKAS